MPKKNKKYYWFKMKSDFFESPVLKRLKRIPGGDTYIVLYINMLSHSVKTEGCLHFEYTEDTFSEELAIILDSDAETVNFLLKLLLKYNVLTVDGDNYYLLDAIGNIGSESESANRVRNYRERQKRLLLNQATESTNHLSTVTSPLHECNNVTVDKSVLQNGYNVTPDNNVTNGGYIVTEQRDNVTAERDNVTKRYIVQKCNTEIEKEIEIEPSSSTEVNINVSKPVDNFGLPVAQGFDAFMQCYPRCQAKRDVVYKAFCDLVSQGVAISDLIAAAKNYADAMHKGDVDMRYIKMPANFLSQQEWLKFNPKFQIDCPTCRGNGVINYPPSDAYPNGHVDFCTCEKRYKAFTANNTLTDIIAQLQDNNAQQG